MIFKYLFLSFLLEKFFRPIAEGQAKGWGKNIEIYKEYASIRFRNEMAHDCFGVVIDFYRVTTSSLCLDKFSPRHPWKVDTLPCLFGRDHPETETGVSVFTMIFTKDKLNAKKWDFERNAYRQMGIYFTSENYKSVYWERQNLNYSTSVNITMDFQFTPDMVTPVQMHSVKRNEKLSNCNVYGRIEPDRNNDSNLAIVSAKFVSHDSCQDKYFKDEPLHESYFCMEESGFCSDLARAAFCNEKFIGVLASENPINNTNKSKPIFLYTTVMSGSSKKDDWNSADYLFWNLIVFLFNLFSKS